MAEVLIINNRDSFVYNLVQLLRENPLCKKVDIVKEDKVDFSILDKYSHILLSPGPGVPEEFPNMLRIIKECQTSHTILGVCLGLQAIAVSFGARLKCLKSPRHGHISYLRVKKNNHSQLLQGIGCDAKIGRYHSWIIDEETLTSDIKITSVDEENNIMSIEYSHLAIYGVQFHPESYMSNCGVKIISNWLKSEIAKD